MSLTLNVGSEEIEISTAGVRINGDFFQMADIAGIRYDLSTNSILGLTKERMAVEFLCSSKSILRPTSVPANKSAIVLNIPAKYGILDRLKRGSGGAHISRSDNSAEYGGYERMTFRCDRTFQRKSTTQETFWQLTTALKTDIVPMLVSWIVNHIDQNGHYQMGHKVFMYQDNDHCVVTRHGIVFTSTTGSLEKDGFADGAESQILIPWHEITMSEAANHIAFGRRGDSQFRRTFTTGEWNGILLPQIVTTYGRNAT